MARTYEVRISIKDMTTEAEVFGKEIVRRISCDEHTGPQAYEKATGGGYTATPTGILDEVQLFFIQPTKQVTVRLDGQSDAGLVINANGIVLLVDVDIDAGASTNVTHDNSSGATADVDLFAAGT